MRRGQWARSRSRPPKRRRFSSQRWKSKRTRPSVGNCDPPLGDGPEGWGRGGAGGSFLRVTINVFSVALFIPGVRTLRGGSPCAVPDGPTCGVSPPSSRFAHQGTRCRTALIPAGGGTTPSTCASCSGAQLDGVPPLLGPFLGRAWVYTTHPIWRIATGPLSPWIPPLPHPPGYTE